MINPTFEHFLNIARDFTRFHAGQNGKPCTELMSFAHSVQPEDFNQENLNFDGCVVETVNYFNKRTPNIRKAQIEYPFLGIYSQSTTYPKLEPPFKKQHKIELYFADYEPPPCKNCEAVACADCGNRNRVERVWDLERTYESFLKYFFECVGYVSADGTRLRFMHPAQYAEHVAAGGEVLQKRTTAAQAFKLIGDSSFYPIFESAAQVWAFAQLTVQIDTCLAPVDCDFKGAAKEFELTNFNCQTCS